MPFSPPTGELYITYIIGRSIESLISYSRETSFSLLDDICDIMISRRCLIAQLIVRNLEDEVRDKLRDLARSHGRSMEEEVRDIIRGAVAKLSTPRSRLGTRFAERFAGSGLDQDIAELRGHTLEPPNFDT